MATGWTYGAELEWPDVDTHTPLPPGWSWSPDDYTIVNTNGVANDPKRRLMRYGGELNTPPAATPHQLAERAADLWTRMRPGHNYRSNLHIHIRIPGLTLTQLTTIADFTRTYLPECITTLDPLTGLTSGYTPDHPHHAYAHARLRHSRQSRHYLLPERNHQLRMAATTIDAALAAEVPRAHQRPQWHLAPREAINLRSLRKHGTIEIRCFAAPTSPDELHAAADAAHLWLACALGRRRPTGDLIELSWRLPRQHPYNHHLETGWAATNLKNNTRTVVARRLNTWGLTGCV